MTALLLHNPVGDEGRAGFTREVSSAAKREEHQNDAKEISADTAAAPVCQAKVAFKKKKKNGSVLKRSQRLTRQVRLA